MRLHPYALILGIGVALMVLFSLRHPAFALVAGLLGTLGFNALIRKKLDADKDKKD